MKMPTIASTFIFVGRENFMLSYVFNKYNMIMEDAIARRLVAASNREICNYETSGSSELSRNVLVPDVC